MALETLVGEEKARVARLEISRHLKQYGGTLFAVACDEHTEDVEAIMRATEEECRNVCADQGKALKINTSSARTINEALQAGEENNVQFHWIVPDNGITDFEIAQHIDLANRQERRPFVNRIVAVLFTKNDHYPKIASSIGIGLYRTEPPIMIMTNAFEHLPHPRRQL